MKICLTLVILLLCSSFFALTKEQIMKSGDYYFGEATAPIHQEARDRAIKELSEKIVVQVRFSTVNMVEETNMKPNEYVKSVIETYSMQTFRNLQEIKSPIGNRMNVFVYIHKDNLNQIFEERRELIFDIYRLAIEAEKDANIGNALKYLYYSIILMYSLPEDRLLYRDIPFHTELPSRIRRILQNTKFQVAAIREFSGSENQIILNMTYNNKKIEYLRFYFWDGSNQILIEGRDGRAFISLFGASKKLKRIEVCPDYMYYDQRNEFKAVADLWDLVKKPDFDARFMISLEQAPEKEEPEISIVADKVPRDYKEVEKSIKAETDKFLAFIKSNNLNRIKTEYAHDVYLQKQIRALLEYNKLRIIDTDTRLAINPTFDGWELRSIPVLTQYPTLNKQSTDSLVLNFDKKGMLNDIQFALFEGSYESALANIEDEEEIKRRQILIKFIEKYRSSFMYRDIETLETMFSDDAVIIVGRVLERTPMNKEFQYRAFGDEPDIEYITHTKRTYLDNLRRVFNRQTDLHLGFNSLKIVVKNNEPGVYSVSMRQNHSSTTYSDEGYLFLLIDFNEPVPKIYVRSWQPGEWSQERMIEMSNFRLN